MNISDDQLKQLLRAASIMTDLVRLKFGNLDREVFEEIEKSELLISTIKDQITPVQPPTNSVGWRYDTNKYCEGSLWYDTEINEVVKLVYCRNVTDFEKVTGGIYSVWYDTLHSRMQPYNKEVHGETKWL